MMSIVNSIFTPLPILQVIWNGLEGFAWLTPISSHVFINTSFLASAIIPMIWFYIYGLWFYYIDYSTSEEWKYSHKVQNSIRITSEQYYDAFLISVRNWLLLGLPYLYFICKLNESWIFTSSNQTPQLPQIPSVFVILRDLIAYIVIEEVMFYFSHRLLHWGSFYASIHKFHHKFTAPCAIAAIYAHPIEHMLSNVIPVAMGPLLMSSHPITSMIWGLLALFNTMTVHSGYDLSAYIVFPAPYFHDWHHEKFNENFGAIQFLDYLLQTNKNYLNTIKKGEMFVPRKQQKKEKKSE